MKACDEHSISVLLYLDGELSGQELEVFRLHLQTCTDCRLRLEEEESLSRLLHRTSPLYSAPDSLRMRITAESAKQASASRSASNWYRKFWQDLMQPLRDIAQPALSWQALAAMTVLVIVGVAFIPSAVQQARARSFVQTAVTTHRCYLNGELPLEIRSDSPEEVTAWFKGKVRFRFQLPSSPPTRYGKPSYRLTGGRLVNYKGGYAALVTYERPTENISLLVASSKSAVAAGGDKVQSGGLVFHYSSDSSFKVITWSNHGNTYALVSSLSGSARQSCLVCHEDMTDHDLFVQHP
jgi:mycothiol system anti-sigma-R factor